MITFRLKFINTTWRISFIFTYPIKFLYPCEVQLV